MPSRPYGRRTARLSIRIDLAERDRIGPGKVRLLESIDNKGSISVPGRALGISYRRAWLLVEELNRLVVSQFGASP